MQRASSSRPRTALQSRAQCGPTTEMPSRDGPSRGLASSSSPTGVTCGGSRYDAARACTVGVQFVCGRAVLSARLIMIPAWPAPHLPL
eukprot:1761982-Rhodomonas_salina.4